MPNERFLVLSVYPRSPATTPRYLFIRTHGTTLGHKDDCGHRYYLAKTKDGADYELIYEPTVTSCTLTGHGDETEHGLLDPSNLAALDRVCRQVQLPHPHITVDGAFEDWSTRIIAALVSSGVLALLA